MIKALAEIPKEGQFVAVWEYGGFIWSGTFKWHHEELYRYCVTEEDDGWELQTGKGQIIPHRATKGTYIILDGGD